MNFLKERIKVNGRAAGKTGQLNEDINVNAENDKVVVTATIPFSKRYYWSSIPLDTSSIWPRSTLSRKLSESTCTYMHQRRTCTNWSTSTSPKTSRKSEQITQYINTIKSLHRFHQPFSFLTYLLLHLIIGTIHNCIHALLDNNINFYIYSFVHLSQEKHNTIV